ncbi:MAG: tRNA (adenosine(37)-N6)-threonylcarbamoyltransferase complex ATPase subunit type 1 TsaE [Opitutales bacterium]
MSIFAELREGRGVRTLAETEALARDLAAALPEDCVLALQGDLGVGKTTLVKGLAAAWGVTQTVKSPSFNLVSIYEGTRQLVHVDAYRLEAEDALESLMLEEFLQSPFCLAVEWPERVRSWLPPETIWLAGELHPDGTRLFQLVE